MLLYSRSNRVLKLSFPADGEASRSAETMFPMGKSATSPKLWVAVYSKGSPLGGPSSVGSGSMSSEGPTTMGPLGPSPLDEQPSKTIRIRRDKFFRVRMASLF